MKDVAADSLQVNMIFSDNVFVDETNLFVHAGIPLRQKDLDNLKAWGVETVQTDGIAYPNKEEYIQAVAQKLNSDLALSAVHDNKGAYPIYTSLIDKMNSIFQRIGVKDDTLDSPVINTISSNLFDALVKHREQFVGFILGGQVHGNLMAKSSVNTAILSALIAQKLKFPRHIVTNNIIGALLHDAGMMRLPKKIIEKQGELSEEERQLIRSHPLHSRTIVTRELSYSDEVGDIVLQHHENWDGSGYPSHNAGEDINIGARIVSIADAFEAMISQKPYRNSMVGYQAMKNLLADSSHHFDPNVLKAFILTMGIYPIGSIVCLNNGAVARVLEVREDAPLRPKIQILIDEKKQIYKNEEGPCIDLLTEKKLYITQATDAKGLSTQYA